MPVLRAGGAEKAVQDRITHLWPPARLDSVQPYSHIAMTQSAQPTCSAVLTAVRLAQSLSARQKCPAAKCGCCWRPRPFTATSPFLLEFKEKMLQNRTSPLAFSATPQGNNLGQQKSAVRVIFLQGHCCPAKQDRAQLEADVNRFHPSARPCGGT